MREAEPDADPDPRFVERYLRRYLDCGILAHDVVIANSCKGRGICPSCSTQRTAETAAHLVDHVFPQVPVRQWVLAFAQAPSLFLPHEPALIEPVLRIFLEAVEDRLKASSPDAPLDARFGAVTFVHRFDAGLHANAASVEEPGPGIGPRRGARSTQRQDVAG